MMKKIEVAQNKKIIEKSLLQKDIEARSAKKELEKVKDLQDQLLEDHYQLNEQLSALKGHVEVLENQNYGVIL